MKSQINRVMELEISCSLSDTDGTIDMVLNLLYQKNGLAPFLSAKLLSFQGSLAFPMWEVSVKFLKISLGSANEAFAVPILTTL